MKGISAFAVVTALIGSLGVAGRAEAISLCDAVLTVPDGRVRTFSGISSSTNDLAVIFQARAGRSYSIESYISGKGYQFGNLSSNVNTLSCPITDMAGLTSTVTIDPAPPNVPNFYRVSVTAAATQAINLRTGNTSANGAEISVKITETTLFSPAWSTNGAYDTFYSFMNTTNATCNGEITLFNQAGTQVASATLSVPPGGTAATNTATLSAPDATTGTARFSHNCPPTAFLATAAIVNFTSTPAYNQIIPFLAPRE